jgi:pyruvate,water dikinase
MASTELIGWFADIGLADRPTVGGKGGSLGELTRASIAVPAGFVVRTASFECCIGELEKLSPVASLVESLSAHDLDRVTHVARDLRRRVEAAVLPEDVRGAILAATTQLGDVPVAVRSSATTEDSADASFAGLQDTYLWVIGADAVLAAVQRCWASL